MFRKRLLEVDSHHFTSEIAAEAATAPPASQTNRYTMRYRRWGGRSTVSLRKRDLIQFTAEGGEIWPVRQGLSFSQNREARLSAVMLAGSVPHDCKLLPVIPNVVEAEPVPGGLGDEGIDLDGWPITGSKTDQASDDEIAECAVVVVPAALFIVAKPLAGLFVEVFADVRLAVEVLAVGVRLERFEIIGFRDVILRVVVEDIRQRRERLRCGERPDGAVPFAGVA